MNQRIFVRCRPQIPLCQKFPDDLLQARLGSLLLFSIAFHIFRPDDIQIVSTDDTGSNTILAKVEVRTYLGKSYQYELSTPIGRLVVNDGSGNLVNAGETMRIMLPSTKIVLV